MKLPYPLNLPEPYRTRHIAFMVGLYMGSIHTWILKKLKGEEKYELRLKELKKEKSK